MQYKSLLLIIIMASFASNAFASNGSKEQVILLGMDGLDFTILRPLLKQGKLPHFEKLLHNAYFEAYKSEKPLRSPAIWTTIATGQHRSKHGIYDFTTNTKLWPKSLRNNAPPELVTSEFRKVKAVWNYVSEAKIPNLTVSWLKTWPAEEVYGTMVAPFAALNSQRHATYKGGIYKDVKKQTYPPEAMDVIKPLIYSPQSLDKKLVDQVATFPQSHSSIMKNVPKIKRYHYSLRWSLAHTMTTTKIIEHYLNTQQPQLVMGYFEGSDSLAHRFWVFRRSIPIIEKRLKQIGADPQYAKQLKAHFGGVIDNYYQLLDQSLGRIMAAASPHASYIIISDHGFGNRRAPVLKNVPYSGDHEMEGVFIYKGKYQKSIDPSEHVSIYDVVPTILSLLSLPIPKELPGKSIVGQASFSAGVDTTRKTKPTNKKTEPAFSSEEMDRLRSLGYVQ